MKKKLLFKLIMMLGLLFIIYGCSREGKNSLNDTPVNTYTVTFDSNGGSDVPQQVVEKGCNIARPNDPNKDGYTFDGWYVGDEKWSFINNTVTVDLYLTAHWKINQYTITIKDYGYSNKVITQDYNTDIVVANPTRVGYIFDGYDIPIPSKMPADNITIQAKWQPIQYTLTIKYNDGLTEDLIKEYDYNSKLDEISNPSRDGYTFIKWSSDIPTNMPARDITIEAVWQINYYSLTLYDYQEAEPRVFRFKYNTTIIISDPYKTGYTFNGWDKDLPVNMPSNDLILTAKWKINQYTLTIKYNDDETEDLIKKYNYGSNIDSIDIPNRMGYDFLGWSEELPTIMPNSDLVITANWMCHVAYRIVDDYIVITGCNKTDGEVIVLNEYEGYGTKQIGTKAFYECDKLTNIYLPDGITSIGYQAFFSCSGLESLLIPESVETIGQNAFANIKDSTYNTYENSKYLGSNNNPYLILVWAKSDVIDFVIPNSCKIVLSNAFSYCNNLGSIFVGKNVTSIGPLLFSLWNNASQIIVDEDNNKYDSRGNCNAVIETSTNRLVLGCCGTIIPDTVKVIGVNAFSMCAGIISRITIPEGVETIEAAAFYKCSNLPSIIIPSSVLYIGDSAFAACDKLTIYCKAESQPTGWSDRWNIGENRVVWGC